MLKKKSNLRNHKRRDSFGLKIPSQDHLTFAIRFHRLAWAGSMDQLVCPKSFFLCEVDISAKEASGGELVNHPRIQV